MMRTRALVLPVVTLALFAAAACSGGCSKPPASTPSAPVEASETATVPVEVPVSEQATPTVESLKDLKLSDLQEGLIFDYLRAGGLAALESRFGKATATYKTSADEAATGSAELADGRFYVIQCGMNAKGAAVVMAHSVEGVSGQTPTPADKAFIAAVKDGTTTLAEANALLKKAGGTLIAAVPTPWKILVPAYVWNSKDGSGFIVVDLNGLTPTQMSELGMDGEGPWQVLFWDATKWRAY